jgi:hypothetical protein
LAFDRARQHARRRPGRTGVNAFSKKPLVCTWFCLGCALATEVLMRALPYAHTRGVAHEPSTRSAKG